MRSLRQLLLSIVLLGAVSSGMAQHNADPYVKDGDRYLSLIHI